MGYTTYFEGGVTIDPPLNNDEISYLHDFADSRRMNRAKGPLYVKGGPNDYTSSDIIDTNNPPRDQPGLWCQWEPTSDGLEIQWNQVEKFYSAGEWMEYLVNKLLSSAAKSYVKAHLHEDERLKSFTCNHVVNGDIYAQGEESDDRWKIKVVNNEVKILDGAISYGDEEEVLDEAEVEEAVRSIRGLGPTEVVTHQFHGYRFEITSVGVDVVDPEGERVANKVSLEEAVASVRSADMDALLDHPRQGMKPPRDR